MRGVLELYKFACSIELDFNLQNSESIVFETCSPLKVGVSDGKPHAAQRQADKTAGPHIRSFSNQPSMDLMPVDIDFLRVENGKDSMKRG